MATGLRGSSCSACPGLALNADPLGEGMQPFHSPTPSANERRPKTLKTNPDTNPNPNFDIKSVQTQSKNAILVVFWAYWAGTTDGEVLVELNVAVPGCPQMQREKNETTLLPLQ